MTTPVRALTLIQPWATAIAVGAKRIETRSWSTSYRGNLLIHAGKAPVYHDPRLDDVLDIRGINLEPMPQGFIVAVAYLVDVVRVDRLGILTSLERELGDFSPGRYGWCLRSVRRLAKPIPARGAQGLWTPSPDLAYRALLAASGE